MYFVEWCQVDGNDCACQNLNKVLIMNVSSVCLTWIIRDKHSISEVFLPEIARSRI